MPTAEELRSIRESVEQLQTLREQLAEQVAKLNAMAGSGSIFWDALAKVSTPRATAEVIANWRQAVEDLEGSASAAERIKALHTQLMESLSALAHAEIDTGRLDALLEQMQRTDKESEEIVYKAARVRERLKLASA